MDADIFPVMQRNYVWTKEKVRALAGSIYKRCPPGSIPLWEAYARPTGGFREAAFPDLEHVPRAATCNGHLRRARAASRDEHAGIRLAHCAMPVESAGARTRGRAGPAAGLGILSASRARGAWWRMRRGVGRMLGGRMPRPGRPGRGRAGPRGGPASGRAGIEAYLEYAREDIERSRMLLGRGDLRYAVFSANVGLELCVKAHMLRYEIIGRAEEAGHFPCLAAVKKLMEIAESNAGRGLGGKRQLKLALGLLRPLEAALRMVTKKDLQVQLWRLSLGMGPAGGRRRCLDKFSKKLAEWCKKMDDAQAAWRNPYWLPPRKCTPCEQDAFFAAVLGEFREKSGRRRGSGPILLPGGGTMPRDRAREMGQAFGACELLLHMDVIMHSFAHQQISRYPTQIDGADSRDLYADHRDGVERLLERIYATVETMSKQVEFGAPLLIQNAVDISADMSEVVPR